MSFKESRIKVSQTEVTVFEAGQGDPCVFLHGAGTASDFSELMPLAENNRLIVPIHPGFGTSGDAVGLDSIMDFVFHYDVLFDELGLDEPFSLIGHSLGGWISAQFAIWKRDRVKKLGLICPPGLKVPEHPTLDLFKVPREQLIDYLISNEDVLKAAKSRTPTVDMQVRQYREMTTLASLIWDRNKDPKMKSRLSRIACPTMILWGKEDKVVPVAQLDVWSAEIPNCKTSVYEGAGHLLPQESPASVEDLATFFGS